MKGRILGGVVFLCLVGLLAASKLTNDWVAVAGCIVVVSCGAIVLEYSGRAEAQRHPHPLYIPGRLPSDSPRIKLVSIILTLALLVMVVSVSVQPGQQASPFPFFLAVGYIFLVLPQVLARRAIRRHDSLQLESVGDGEEAEPRKRRKKRKHKKK